MSGALKCYRKLTVVRYMGVDSDEEDVEQALSRKKKKTKIRSKKAKRVLDDDDSIVEEAVPECFCGAPNCRGKLFNTQNNVVDK